MDKIEKHRKSIDKIDDEIMSLLEQRLCLAVEIGKAKSISKANVLDTKREKIILNKVSNYSHSPEIDTIYRKIMEMSKSLQRE